MMTIRNQIVALASIAPLLFLAACSASDPESEDPAVVTSQNAMFAGRFTFTPDPPTTGENQLEMALERDGAALVGAHVHVEPWMPAHGHGSPVAPSVEEVGVGRYLARDVVISMPGTWEFRIDVSTGELSDRFVLSTEIH